MKKIIYLAAIAVLFSCSKEERKNALELDLNLTGEMMQVNTQTVIQDATNQNNYYSQIDTLIKYGYGYKIVLPDSLKEKTLKVIISADVKETETVTGEFVVSINEPNMTSLFWGNRAIAGQLKELNTWKPFKDSVIIGAAQNPKKNSHLYIFNTKFTGGGVFCVDNFKVKVIKE
ncbi:MAG: hypothetical protein JNM51_14485 [Bacteroidia bacterium]|nr:hypothetical protein [Bacteroidia bacterium]